MSLKVSDIVVGAKVYTSIAVEPWEVIQLDGPYAVLAKSGRKTKMVKIKSMIYVYHLVGSEAHKKFLKHYEERGWRAWAGYNE